MKAEDLEVGEIYVMLEDDVYMSHGVSYGVRIAEGEKVKFMRIISAKKDLILVECGKTAIIIAASLLGEIPTPKLPTAPDKYEQHRLLCEKIHSTYVAKNKDYGDSFTRTRREAKHPDEVIIVRLSDKFYRLKTLLEGAEQQVKGESVDDSLLDMANYLIMELLERAK